MRALDIFVLVSGSFSILATLPLVYLAFRSYREAHELRRIQLEVALGVFAYNEGGTAAVGIAGLVRLLPAAIVAPFAASLGDRFRRERFLLALTLVGAAALAGSAVAALAGQRVVVFALAAVVGLVATLFRPALVALLPSLARTPEELIASNGATATIEGLGTLV